MAVPANAAFNPTPPPLPTPIPGTSGAADYLSAPTIRPMDPNATVDHSASQLTAATAMPTQVSAISTPVPEDSGIIGIDIRILGVIVILIAVIIGAALIFLYIRK